MLSRKAKGNLTYDEIRGRIYKYCAFQERSESEVAHKLKELGGSEEERSELLEELIRGKFVDDERFCRSFVRGKFRKGWGKMKIKMALGGKGIDRALADKILKEEIKEEDYEDKKEKLIAKKEKELSKLPEKERKLKVKQFLFRKGFSG